MLGKSDWDFDADPCGVEGGWGDKVIGTTSKVVTCENSIDAHNNNISHIVSIVLKEQSLAGILPPRLFRLPWLQYFDLSYNKFTAGSECQEGSANLFASSKVENATSYSATSGLVSCLRSKRCAKSRYKLFINCGGSKAEVRGTTYEADSEEATPSSFLGSDYWAYSSTSYFADDDGPYNVTLHFAEIMFTGNKSYKSLGRRAFNIYIQVNLEHYGVLVLIYKAHKAFNMGKLVWKDFNIEIEAGGVGKEVMKNFTANVTKGTLEIRFYWAGKGTTAIPDGGVYGPLISAISVYPGFDPPASRASISGGTVAGILAAIVFVVFLILVIL